MVRESLPLLLFFDLKIMLKLSKTQEISSQRFSNFHFFRRREWCAAARLSLAHFPPPSHAIRRVHTLSHGLGAATNGKGAKHTWRALRFVQDGRSLAAHVWQNTSHLFVVYYF